MRTSKKTESASTTTKIRIIYQRECSKLTAQGKRTLSHELGVDDESKEEFIRIAANSQGGTYSFEWISRNFPRKSRSQESCPQCSAFQEGLFWQIGNQSRIHLAAIMRAENVIASDPQHASQLTYLSFDETMIFPKNDEQ